MTDLEISKALALAIGWDKQRFDLFKNRLWLITGSGRPLPFDYRDWNVIGPIAERYDAFPFQTLTGWESWLDFSPVFNADTPQKAIALAVIEGAKT